MSIRKKTIILAVLFTVIVALFGELFLYAFAVRASAAESVGIDDTSIEDDLSGIDLTIYPANSFGKASVISFMEYAYSESNQFAEEYAIYLYIYNPTQKNIIFNEQTNITLSCAFDAEGNISKFDKYPLEFLDSNENNTIFKARLKVDNLLIIEREYFALNGIRKYEIVDLEICFAENNGSVESFDVSGIYEFSGYAAYCAPDSSPESTLVSKFYGNDTINLDLNHTNYRFENYTEFVCDELNSVYFSVPKEYHEKFGNLVTINAQWYEYKTKPIFVTSDLYAYTALKRYLNKPMTPRVCIWRILWEEEKNAILSSGGYNSGSFYAKNINGNADDRLTASSGHSLQKWDGVNNKYVYSVKDSIIRFLFYRDNVKTRDDYAVSTDELIAFMRNNSVDIAPENLVAGKYDKWLFTDIDEDRKYLLENNSSAGSGLVKVNIDATEMGEYTTVDAKQNWWDKLLNGSKNIQISYNPIVVIEEYDWKLSDAAFSELYLVNIDDVLEIKEYAKECYKKNQVPYLMRFAVTDYYASTARFDECEVNGLLLPEPTGYVAQETVFLNFDILSLGFENEGGMKTILGVVAAPIDIINAITAPSDLEVQEQAWWQVIVALLGLILLIVAIIFLWPIISPILSVVISLIVTAIKFIFKILTLPFRLLGRLIFGK